MYLGLSFNLRHDFFDILFLNSGGSPLFLDQTEACKNTHLCDYSSSPYVRS